MSSAQIVSIVQKVQYKLELCLINRPTVKTQKWQPPFQLMKTVLFQASHRKKCQKFILCQRLVFISQPGRIFQIKSATETRQNQQYLTMQVWYACMHIFIWPFIKHFTRTYQKTAFHFKRSPLYCIQIFIQHYSRHKSNRITSVALKVTQSLMSSAFVCTCSPSTSISYGFLALGAGSLLSFTASCVAQI